MKVLSKEIPGYSRYLIYSDGQVWDLVEEKFCDLQVTISGYLRVRLKCDGCNRGKQFYVHRLVAQAFISNPENKPEVDHKDTDKTNNTVVINDDDGSVNEELSNLHWVTRKENCSNPLTRQHQSENHADISGENNPNYGKHFEWTDERKQAQSECMSDAWSDESRRQAQSEKIRDSWTNERKQAQSERMSGENNPFYNKRRTDEFKQAQSERMSGENNPMYGKPAWNKGTHLSEEEKVKRANKKWRNKITGRITNTAGLTTMIKNGKTTQDQWDLVENN